MRRAAQATWLVAGFLVGASLQVSLAGNGLDSFGPAQGAGGGGGTDLSGLGSDNTLALWNGTDTLDYLANGATGTVLIGGSSPSYTATPLVTGLTAGSGVTTFDTATRGITLGTNAAALLVDPDSGAYLRAYSYTTTAGDGSGWSLVRGRGTHSSPSAVTNDDLLGFIDARGATGSGLTDEGSFAAIYAMVDSSGSVSTTSFPGRLSFYTTANGSNSLAERIRINNSGTVDIGAGVLAFGSAIGANTATARQGSGSPEGVVTANVGAIYLRSDGSNSTTLYVKQNGSGNTGWTAFGPASNSVAIVVCSDPTAIDLTARPVQTLTLSGDTTFGVAGGSYSAGNSIDSVVIVTCDGTERTLTFDGDWEWIGTKPTSLLSGARALLHVWSTGSDATGVIATWTLLGSGA